MKNKFKSVITVLVVTTMCLMFTSFSPSLDGRAVVVEKGVFPQGLFAKTVGYLPGDVIKVSNVAGNANVEILVIGALDPSEGVAIMLSPEAAAALGIEKNSNNIVKITKRSGQDERVYGNAMISSSPAGTKDVDGALADSIVENEESFEDISSSKTEEENTATVPEANDEVSQEVEGAPSKIDAEDESMPEENQEEFGEEEKSESEDVADSESENIPEHVEEEVEQEVEPESEPVENDDFAEEQIEPEEAENEVEPQSESEENSEAPTEEFYEDEVPPENPVDEESVEEEELPAVTEEKAPEEVPPEEEADEEYDAIVLVPADEMPPTEEENPEVENPVEENEDAEESASEEQIPDEDVFAENDELQEYEPIVIAPSEEENQVAEQAPESEETEVHPAFTEQPISSYEKYIVGNIDNLESGKYYIQIATLTIDKNIMEIVDKYANNYPVSIVKMSGGIKKQIFIGPLSIDEYAVVLERFKSYGYKDAFVRKIK
ncbi:hypothetical protein [Treponema sp. Marseille-Q3903]|uniref:hypothetical protein n=1 Tax=Treponema sp. Marseille-Q3903 TaxID=2766703 RepID=UPI001651B3CC|nr:hypothetical protein [Treponema sp. Marseille-Q3903]MBC6713375.1 hypothetical protein [Treponema sp. Marseille-Q3903]